MKHIYICLFLFLPACSNNEQIGISQVKIIRTQQHSFLIDHHRKLLVLDRDGKPIDEITIYSDTGEGCHSFLYDTGTTFSLVDCNGQWYVINKKSGGINKEDWQWKKPLPAKYLGTFIRESKDPFYTFVTGPQVTIQKVYQFKDPND